MRSSVRVSLCGAACPDIVTVSGAEATQQGFHMGTYMKVSGVVQQSRPVYRMGPTGHYLFYFSTNSWNIGADYKVNIVGLQSFTAAACPDQAIGWRVYTGNAWGDYPVKVQLGAPCESCACMLNNHGTLRASAYPPHFL